MRFLIPVINVLCAAIVLCFSIAIGLGIYKLWSSGLGMAVSALITAVILVFCLMVVAILYYEMS